MRGSLHRVGRDERGVSAVVVSVTLVALFGAAMLTLDAGSLWATRRHAITGTDAAALDAAYYFNTVGNPCSSTDLATAETGATNVLARNDPDSIHDATATPNGFEVTTSVPCGTDTYVPGKVRFDSRTPSGQSFSEMFGFEDLNAFSSSTAAWGYIVAIGQGLRPIAICDQSTATFANPLPLGPGVAPYPHFYLWNQYRFGSIDQTTYDSYFGSDHDLLVGPPRPSPHYPQVSSDFVNGTSNQNPNRGDAYIAPNGTNGFHTVHRIKMPDPDCGIAPGDRIWVDLTGTGGGTVGASNLTDQIRYGYKGTVSLSPHDCNTGDDIAPPENCGGRPGDVSNPSERALGDITCDKEIPAADCPLIFPVVLFDQIIENGSNAEYHQVAFVSIVLRGFGGIRATSVELDVEFVTIQGTGMVGASNPSPNVAAPMKGIQLCGADHDGGDHCPF